MKAKSWQLSGADYDFDTPVTADLTLTAHFTAVAEISYKDAAGEAQTTSSYSPLSRDITGDVTFGAADTVTWLAVTDTISVSGRITLLGDVHLILADGKTLTVPKGVTVNADAATLTVYG